VIILNEAATMNRLTPGLQSGLMRCLQALPEHPDIRALVLTADGKAFCAGADLDTMAPAQKDRLSLGERTARAMREQWNPLIMSLRSLDLPVVIAVNGIAVGGGVGLALAGDIVLMARSASLLLPSMPRLGILPDLGATWALERIAGRSRAMALTLLGDRLSADAAVQFGLASASIDDANLRLESIRLAQRLALLPKGAAREARAAFEAAAHNDLESQLLYESTRQADLIDRPAFAEGVRAFLEKREPDFRSLA
jgi:2-(1,2-epoxy-1,2-dihydrophenyl)acetyl-CoA isomerase